MKKLIFIAFLCCIAANAFTAESEFGEVSDLIKENLFRNADKSVPSSRVTRRARASPSRGMPWA